MHRKRLHHPLSSPQPPSSSSSSLLSQLPSSTTTTQSSSSSIAYHHHHGCHHQHIYHSHHHLLRFKGIHVDSLKGHAVCFNCFPSVMKTGMFYFSVCLCMVDYYRYVLVYFSALYGRVCRPRVRERCMAYCWRVYSSTWSVMWGRMSGTKYSNMQVTLSKKHL